MIFHENRLLADDSHEISYLIFFQIRKDVAKVVCCSRNWRIKGSLFFTVYNAQTLNDFRNIIKLSFCWY